MVLWQGCGEEITAYMRLSDQCSHIDGQGHHEVYQITPHTLFPIDQAISYRAICRYSNFIPLGISPEARLNKLLMLCSHMKYWCFNNLFEVICSLYISKSSLPPRKVVTSTAASFSFSSALVAAVHTATVGSVFWRPFPNSLLLSWNQRV